MPGRLLLSNFNATASFAHVYADLYIAQNAVFPETGIIEVPEASLEACIVAIMQRTAIRRTATL
jgi:hypothetical protein